MEFKKREIIEMNFVFCLWKNPRIYAKYMRKINEMNKFLEFNNAKLYYEFGKKMIADGIVTFDKATILTYISSNELLEQEFSKIGGYREFEIVSKSLDEKNIDSFFNSIIKMNVINELEQKGFNVQQDYGKIQSMTVDEIKAYYSYQLNDIFLKTGSETRIEEFSITDDDIEYFNKGSQMGLSIASTSPLLNYEILGLNKGLTFVAGHVNQGKTSFSFAIIVRAWLEHKIKCGIISNEQTIFEFKQLLIAMVSYELYGDKGLDRRRLKIGHYNNPELEKFKKVQETINEKYAPYIRFIKIFNYSIDDVESVVRTLSAQGFTGFIYDVFKAADGASSNVIGEMKEMSKQLFRLADETNSSVIATAQLGLYSQNKRYLQLEDFSTSKQITEVATEALLLRSMWDDEVTGGKYDVKIKKPIFDTQGNPMRDAKGKQIMQDVTIAPEEYKSVKLVFLAKTRNAELGTVLAYKFLGSHNQWKELGYAYPSFENRMGR